MRIPLLSSIALIALPLLMEIYIFADIRTCSVKSRRKLRIWTFGIIACITLALAITVVAWPKRNPDIQVSGVMWILYTFLSILFSEATYIIFSIFGRLVKSIFKIKKHPFRIIGAVAAAGCFLTFWIGAVYTRNHIQVNAVTIASEKLPPGFNGFRIVNFSDAHVGTWGTDTAFVSRLVDKINSLHPDAIFFTGDMVNRQSAEIDPFLPVWRRLHAPFGVWVVMGNHDYGGYVDWPDPGDANKDAARLVERMQSMGWNVLKNENAVLTSGGDSIILIGAENWGEPPFNTVGDLNKSYPEMPSQFRGLNDASYKILLTHNPMHWTEIASKASNIDLTFSGHTHAMQVMFRFGNRQWSPSVWRYPQWGGLYSAAAKDGTDMKLYVGIGVGEVGFPARLFAAYPEITEVTLLRE